MLQGRCLCGAVRFAATGEPLWVAHCHCESCRRATSAPMATYVGFAASQVAWSGEAPEIFRSSPGVQRSFCRRCGSPMSYASEGSPGEIHLFAASFERPETLAPSVHVFAGEQLPWLQMADGLPRFAKLSKDEPPLV
ncbi:MAG: GFA family protein [Burkholderiaceae bacterium]|nr:GFA family protein [Burkholderiaceae bacterium]